MNVVVIFHAKFHHIFVVVEGDVLVVSAALPAEFDEAAEAAAAMAIERP